MNMADVLCIRPLVRCPYCAGATFVKPSGRLITHAYRVSRWGPVRFARCPQSGRLPTAKVGTSDIFRDEPEIGTQCARCGSSVDRLRCDDCGGDGFILPDDFDSDSDEDRRSYARCGACDGKGGWWRCMSSDAFCDANPLPGRESVKSGEVETYVVPR